MIGIEPITAAVMTKFQIVNDGDVAKVLIPTGRVFKLSDVSTNEGHIKSPQVHINLITITVAIAGIEFGIIILNSTPIRLQPSIMAASSNSFGIEINDCLNKKIAKGLTKLGAIIAIKLSFHPS